MRPGKPLLFTLVAAAGFLLHPQAEVKAQFYLGAHGSVGEINRTAWGLGARLGAVVHQSSDLTLALEGVGEYFWPSCDQVDCGVVAFAGNLLARQRVASYAEVYGGVGVIYEHYTIENDLARRNGDDIGFSILVGTQSGTPGGTRPFLEVRYSWMGELENQAAVALGFRVPIG